MPPLHRLTVSNRTQKLDEIRHVEAKLQALKESYHELGLDINCTNYLTTITGSNIDKLRLKHKETLTLKMEEAFAAISNLKSVEDEMADDIYEFKLQELKTYIAKQSLRVNELEEIPA